MRLDPHGMVAGHPWQASANAASAMAGLTISPATTVMLKALKPGVSAAIPRSAKVRPPAGSER